MSDGDDFARAAEEHRAAVKACETAIGAVAREDWDRRGSAKKWSAAEIAEHLAISYDPPLAELGGREGFRVLLPWWKRRLARWKYLPLVLGGGFPTGVPAPREIRPTGSAPDPQAGARRLSERAEAFLDCLAEARASHRRAVRLTHPYFGRLSDVQALRLLTSHLRHHGRQLPGGARAISSRAREGGLPA